DVREVEVRQLAGQVPRLDRYVWPHHVILRPGRSMFETRPTRRTTSKTTRISLPASTKTPTPRIKPSSRRMRAISSQDAMPGLGQAWKMSDATPARPRSGFDASLPASPGEHRVHGLELDSRRGREGHVRLVAPGNQVGAP